LPPSCSDIREGLKAWHFALGVSVLVLVAFRALLQVTHAAPRIEPEPPRWQLHLATLMHLALYALMIGMPLLGWLTLSAQGKQIPFFGLHLPPLMAEQKSIADWSKELHEVLGTVGYFLIALHASAALYHHYFVRDNTLRRMVPGQG